MHLDMVILGKILILNNNTNNILPINIVEHFTICIIHA